MKSNFGICTLSALTPIALCLGVEGYIQPKPLVMLHRALPWFREDGIAYEQMHLLHWSWGGAGMES